MIADAINNALARACEPNAQDFELPQPPVMGLDEVQPTWVTDHANDNDMGITNTFGFHDQVTMNNQLFVDNQMVENNTWAMAPNLAATTQVANNNYADMAGYTPMNNDVAMSNPMVTNYYMPTVSTTMATGQFFTGAPDIAGAYTMAGNNVSAGPSTSIGMVAGFNAQATAGTTMATGQLFTQTPDIAGGFTMGGNNVSAGPSTSIGMVAGPNTQATTGNNAMAMPTQPTMPAPAARPAARASPARTPRPAGPRVMCTMCDEHPGGFRGRHELNRHVELKHNNPGTTWICLDPGNEATVGDHKIQKPFKKCKRCTGLKEYNSLQNAIDHLRRGHFIPKWHTEFKDEDRVLPRELPAKAFVNWVRTIGGTAPTGPQPANQATAVAPPPAPQAPAIAPPPAPQAPIIAPPAPQNPAATPESTVSSSDQGSDATGSVASGGDTVSPPDAEQMFQPETVMFLLKNHCVLGEDQTIDPALLTNNQ